MAKYDLIINSEPNSNDASVKRVALYNRVTDYERAVADLDRVISLNSDLAEAYHQRGKAYEGLGKKDKAIADFSKFLELSREDTSRNDAKEHLQSLGVTPR